MAREITQFVGAHQFLSNFYMHPVSYDGRVWPSSEHAYQAAKTDNQVSKSEICKAKTAMQAKDIGRFVRLRPDWEEIKLQIMADILKQKFRNPDGRMGWKLLQTGDAILIEGNHWGDRFWGAVRVGTEWQGENHLGRLLMAHRAYLRSKVGARG